MSEYVEQVLTTEITESLLKEKNNYALILEFLELLDKARLSKVVKLLAIRSYKYYKYTRLAYHNFQHIVTVLKSIGTLTNDFRDTDIKYAELILAACYHDAVYIPGCAYNEDLAAKAFSKEHDDLRLEIGQHYTLDHYLVEDLIISTKVSNHLTTHHLQSMEVKVLMDADLASLAYNYVHFRENNKRIISENLVNGESITISKLIECNDFLQLFAKKDFIYRTIRGRSLGEHIARENISALQRNLSSSVITISDTNPEFEMSNMHSFNIWEP